MIGWAFEVWKSIGDGWMGSYLKREGGGDYKSIMSEDKGEEVNQIKLIAVGDSGVGKTSILTRFTYEKFSDYSEPTLGAAFLTKKHTLSNGKSIEFHVPHPPNRSGILLGRRSTARSHPFTIARHASPFASMTLPLSAPMRS